MTLEKLEELLKKSKILQKYNLETLTIFGSVARGLDGNDIDILVDDDDFPKLINFKKELENLTNTKVDIMILKYANPIILYRAEKEKVVIMSN